MKFFTAKVSWCLTLATLKQQSWYNISKYSRENFRGALENRKKHESLAQRVFPLLRYVFNQ